MPSLEQLVKNQFARVFASSDWRLFKEVAEINFAEAATLMKRSFPTVARRRQLLVRNTRKRLLIGIGAELLLKASYLKSGYGINRPLDEKTLKAPFKLAQVGRAQLNPNDTFNLGQLTDQLKKVLKLSKPDIAIDGLRIAKVFRNKEGHVVTQSHKYDPLSYRRIEAALVEIYSDVFNENLTVRFSFEPWEKGRWQVTSHLEN